MRLFGILLGLLLLVGCARDQDYLITIHTQFGDIKMILHDQTPLHKANFLQLAESGKFDSTIFHRVLKEFMVQGGDVTMRPDVDKEPDLIPAEFNDQLIHVRGAVAAARRGDQQNPEKKSSGSQFYIVQGKKFTDAEFKRLEDDHILNQIQPHFGELINRQSNDSIRLAYLQAYEAQEFEQLRQIILSTRAKIEDEFGKKADLVLTARQREVYSSVGGAPHLDEGYTVFGMVLEGLHVVDTIATQQVGPQAKPLQEIYMTLTLEKVNKKRITEDYGYQYPSYQ